MRLTLILAVALLVAGCAWHFGHENPQTLIDVRTTPPRLPYYVLTQTDAERVIGSTSAGLVVRDELEFKKLLNLQLSGLVSNTSALTYTMGSYMLVVKCPEGFRFQHFDARNQSTNVVMLECS